MRSIWMGIHPRADGTRILATAGPEETLLKAKLRADPQHPRAMATLLEALALWEGLPVRAALAVDGSGNGCGMGIYRESFADVGATPLYTLEYVPHHRRRRRRDDLGGLGDFRDLRRLLLFEVAR
jgi:hypothetical protein